MREIVSELSPFHVPIWMGGSRHYAYSVLYGMAGQIAGGIAAAAAEAAGRDGTSRRIWQPWFDDDERKDPSGLSPPPSSSVSSGVLEVQRSDTYSGKHLPTKLRKEKRLAERGLLETRSRHQSAPPPPYPFPNREIDAVIGPKCDQSAKDFTDDRGRVGDSVGSEDDQDYEAPLDMTTQARRKSPTPASRPLKHQLPPNRPPSYSAHLPRPSVITCLTENSTTDQAITTSGQVRTGRRDTTSPGVCDSVIDEHFRRSLGDRYTHLFASSGSSSEGETAKSPACSGQTSPPNLSVSGLSVDDHFAKALGDTWFKLQQTQSKDSETDTMGRTTAAGLLFSA